jgi:hypothetical protein
MKIISFIERHQREVIEKILRHCGLWEEASVRAPPVQELVLGRRGFGNVADHSRAGLKKIADSLRVQSCATALSFRRGFAEPINCQFLSLSAAPLGGYPPVHREKANAGNVRYAHAGGQPRPPRS